MIIPAKDIARFESKLDKQENGCWLWLGTKDDKNYGRFFYKGKIMLAHRFSYELYKESIIDGLFCCHVCDNPSCVNPNHLWLGTQKDNMQDMIHKGRKGILSEEVINKLSIRSKGNKYGLGKKHTEEAKFKMSIACMGNKNGIGNTNALGYKHTEETKLKIGLLSAGHKYNLGRKHTEETKLKIRQTNLERWEKRRNACSNI